MSMDLTGINNYNEYYTNHYFSSIFEENAEETINAWRVIAKESEEIRTPWSLLRENSKQFYSIHNRYLRLRTERQALPMIRDMADLYLESLGFPEANPFIAEVNEEITAPVYLEIKKSNGAPLLWVLLSHTEDTEVNLMQGYCFDAGNLTDETCSTAMITTISNEDLATSILYSMTESPRWLIIIGLNQVALIDRNKWSEKRYLEFDFEEIFSRREDSTFKATAVLLHRESLCPYDGIPLLDKLDENSHRHAAGVSQALKYSLRESIELLGNEVIYDMQHRLGRSIETEPIDAAQLTIECLRYMYRMLFMLFIEARPELGYTPMKSQPYVQGYSLESLRDIADNIREETSEVGEGFYLHETLSKLYELIYNGYPQSEEMLKEMNSRESLHDIFTLDPLKAHIFDPEYTPMITESKLRNSAMLKIIDLMSITRAAGKRNERRGRISYATLGINQLGAVYEALLSYRGFIAVETLYEVKRKGDTFNELDVGYFVTESDLDNYEEDERVRYQDGKLRKYDRGTFIYRLAGREREKSASYYTPEVLTKALVKYALQELLENKKADEILQLTVCEPAMGSAAFLNEAINQLAEAYLDKKQKELGISISYESRYQELQRVKMYIADRNVYGIDLNPVAVELAEVSLWLNTIYKGSFVPWFGTQIVNGNSLIGARKQCYRVEQLQANRTPERWFDNAPDRVLPGSRRMPKKQVYHFLTGDPDMASYTDKVIKKLVPGEIKAIKEWNKQFVAPYNEDEVQTLLRLSAAVDDLWAKQVELRKAVGEQTADALSVFGHDEDIKSSHTTIREKDLIYKRLYKSEELENAGPYARLKFAMDYWCALWFWPIEKADLLPSRSEFMFDMSLILEGGIISVTKDRNLAHTKGAQISLLPTEMDKMVDDIFDLYKDLPEVDLATLCERNPRLQIIKEISEKNKFLHWELEFANLFEERGGFDLIIGNPPWIKMTWNEQAVLSDRYPLFGVKNFTAKQTAQKRTDALADELTLKLYYSEYESMSGVQNFLNSIQNYAVLKGQQTNLFKCFLPQAWYIGNGDGISAFVHPDGVYDDPRGGVLREKLYPRLRKHFQFTNELKLFTEVDHHMGFSLNIYGNNSSSSFDSIANLFDVNTIEQCYEGSITGEVPGIKDSDNKWNIEGHSDRVIHVGKRELELFAKLFDGSDNWKQARLPVIHARTYIDVLNCFALQKNTIKSLKESAFTTEMWHETNAQNDGTIIRSVHFPDFPQEMIYSGPHIGVANPIFKTSRRVCRLNSDYDSIDLSNIPNNYFQRCNYYPLISIEQYEQLIPVTPWGDKYNNEYRVVMRKMMNLSGERTLISAIVPKKTTHINGIFGICFRELEQTLLASAFFASLPYDFFIKCSGKTNLYDDYVGRLPIVFSKYSDALMIRTLMLNSLTHNYYDFWEKTYKNDFSKETWSKIDFRLSDTNFSYLKSEWTYESPLRTDYARRQALIEIDVLAAMALQMTLKQLQTIYRIQFPVLQSYEADTWYDQNGRIVFTNNRSLTGIGYSRTEWNEMKDAKSGIFRRTIKDDTQPGGPVERIIEYVAPFDRCDRGQDYETVWAFFEEKYKDK